jgi:hypothetical protein
MASMVDCSALEASGLAEKLNKDDSLWCAQRPSRCRPSPPPPPR